MKISLALYYNIVTQVLFIIIILLLAFVVNTLYIYNKDLKLNSTDLYQYKITNFFYTLFCIISYSFIFILLSYYLRFLYLNKIVNLKVLYTFLIKFFNFFLDYTFLLKIYIISIFILVILCFVVICIIIQTLCFREFFKLHIFIFTKYLFEKIEKRKDIPYYYIIYVKLINLIGSSYKYIDPISGVIIYYSWRMDETFNLRMQPFIFNVFMNKYYKIIYYMSPILIICYECVFNNWILFHFFWFMIIYSFLTIIKRIADSIFPLNHYLLSILSDIYYKNNNTFIISIPLHLKEWLFSNYLSNHLKTNIDLFFSGVEESNLIFIMANKDFIQDKNNLNMMTNKEGLTLIKLSDGKLFRLEFEYEEGKYELGEEWIILQDNSLN